MHDPTRQPPERVSRERFDMIVTFTDETQARQALSELRRTGFGPEQALLLRPEDASSDLIAPDGRIRFPTAELVADRTVAIWIILCTELVVGALFGVLVGWIIALFLNEPNIGPVWPWIVGLGAGGAVGGLALGSLEWRKWRRQLDMLRKQVAIGLRFEGRNPAADLAQARSILERHGGLGIDNT